MSVVAVLYISSVFLTWYAQKAGDPKASELMRKYALIWAGPLMASALGIIIELKSVGSWHYDQIVDIIWLFALSGIVFLATVWLLKKKIKYGLAVVLLIAQFAMAFFAYGISHYPYLLYPYLTIHDSFTNQTMAIAIVIAFVAGLVLLIPSLYLVFKLFFNKRYVSGKEETHV